MPCATRGDQTLRATARDFAYYLLRDLRDAVREFFVFLRWFDPHRSELLQRQCGRLRDCLRRFDSLWEGIR